MRSHVRRSLGWLVVAAAIAVPAVVGAQVSVNVNIGPPPTYVVPAAPALVIVPGTPVFYAPSVPFNFFVYSGRYYTHHRGHWYHRHPHGGPWLLAGPGVVPAQILAVPAGYYKIPPGHWKKGGPHHGRGHGKGGKHWKED